MELTTAEEQNEWEGYLCTNPERVFEALSILDPRSIPNKWGDTHAVRVSYTVIRSMTGSRPWYMS